jgi:AhpD family alkylhydroperoxidase
MPRLVEYAEAGPEVRAVFDAIKAARGVADVNNFWKALAVDPPTLKRTWESLNQVMAPGALDPVVKEMLYLAASMAAGCAYCTASHGAAARTKGMSDAMYGELIAIVGMAAETNRLAEALRVPVDPAFD